MKTTQLELIYISNQQTLKTTYHMIVHSLIIQKIMSIITYLKELYFLYLILRKLFSAWMI